MSSRQSDAGHHSLGMSSSVQTPPCGEFLIRDASDVVRARRIVNELAIGSRLSAVNRVKLVTAASELARNVVKYAKRGTMRWTRLTRPAGLQLVFDDQGPGIADLKLAMLDGWSSGGSLGFGLAGTRRLVDGFSIESNASDGTRVTIVMWTPSPTKAREPAI